MDYLSTVGSSHKEGHTLSIKSVETDQRLTNDKELVWGFTNKRAKSVGDIIESLDLRNLASCGLIVMLNS